MDFYMTVSYLESLMRYCVCSLLFYRGKGDVRD